VLTETEAKNELRIPDDLEEVEYPPEVIARWDRIVEETKAQLAAGEIVPMTAAEFAAEVMRNRRRRNSK